MSRDTLQGDLEYEDHELFEPRARSLKAKFKTAGVPEQMPGFLSTDQMFGTVTEDYSNFTTRGGNIAASYTAADIVKK